MIRKIQTYWAYEDDFACARSPSAKETYQVLEMWGSVRWWWLAWAKDYFLFYLRKYYYRLTHLPLYLLHLLYLLYIHLKPEPKEIEF